MNSKTRRVPPVATVVLAAALLVACGDGDGTTTSTEPAAATATVTPATTAPRPTTTGAVPTTGPPGEEQITLTRYSDGLLGFSILFPAGWEVVTNPDPGSGIAVLFTGPGYPEGPAVHVFAQDVPAETTAEQYLDFRIGEILDAVPDQEFIEQGETLLGADPALFLAYATNVEPLGLELFFGEVIAVIGERAYIATYNAPFDTWQDFGAVYVAMTDSFEVQPTASP